MEDLQRDVQHALKKVKLHVCLQQVDHLGQTACHAKLKITNLCCMPNELTVEISVLQCILLGHFRHAKTSCTA